MNFKKYGLSTPIDLLNFFEKNMKYGFTYRGKIFTEQDEDFQEKMNKLYKLRLKDDFVKSGYGVCWDFCEFEREFFKFAHIPCECFFLESEIKNVDAPTHTFALIQNKAKKWFWFEFSWASEEGLHEYSSKEEALQDIVKKFVKFCKPLKVDKISIFKTQPITRRVDVYEFVKLCKSGEKIKEICFQAQIFVKKRLIMLKLSWRENER